MDDVEASVKKTKTNRISDILHLVLERLASETRTTLFFCFFVLLLKHMTGLQDIFCHLNLKGNISVKCMLLLFLHVFATVTFVISSVECI